MRHYQNVALIWGVLALGLAALALLHGLVSAGSVKDGAAPGFFACALVSGFFGGLLAAFGRGAAPELSFRAAAVLTVGAWTGVPLLAAIPLAGPETGLDLTDAVFESISGFTTTGSTVMTGLDETAPTILFWRAMLQWVGGIGIIGLSIAILPLLRTGGMQLFRMESSDRSPERLIARPGQLAAVIAGLYLGLTVLCALAYAMAGMSGFEAASHALTTVSTGGYSTSDSSLGGFPPAAQWAAVVFMLSGAIPFLAYVRAVSRFEGRRPGAYEEVAGLFGLAAVFAAILYVAALGAAPGEEGVLRLAVFNTVSVITTTGYASGDYQLWGPLAMAAIFALTFVGGCAGSTSGGFKVFRIQIMLKAIWAALNRAPNPHAVIVTRHAGRRLTNDDIASVALFAGLYVAVFALGAVMLAALGLDFMTAVTGSATAIANVGPGLGELIGPAGNFTAVPDEAKWILCVQMLLGRLEIVAVLYLITPRFWRG
ncbi:MAG: TrkH family potassium uptake protein [Oceanicaulis sp.]